MADLEGVWSLGVEVRRLRAALDVGDAREPGWTLHDEMAATDRLADDVRRLRGLLARALPHIDPNDSDDAHRLLVECEEATRG